MTIIIIRAILPGSQAWFPSSQLRPRQRPISSQNKDRFKIDHGQYSIDLFKDMAEKKFDSKTGHCEMVLSEHSYFLKDQILLLGLIGFQ